MAKLKVYGVRAFSGRIPSNSHQVRAVVAAPSKKAAAEAVQMSMYEFNSNGTETFNAIEVQVALGEPGIVFVCSQDRHIGSTEEFVRVPNGEKP